MKTILLLTCFFLFIGSFTVQLEAQNSFLSRLHPESRFYSSTNVSGNSSLLSGAGITFVQPLSQFSSRKMVICHLLIPSQFVSNYSNGENLYNALAIGAILKVDIGTVNGASKWFFSPGIGKELYFNNVSGAHFRSGALLSQLGLRYINTDALFKDLEFGFTSSLFLFNASRLDFNSLNGLYIRLSVF
jgi:hypothetical protein